MEQINKERFSNIELLRIVAMLMIVTSHFFVHDIVKHWHINSTLTSYINDVLACFFTCGRIGVCIFVLISGYFMVKQDFKFSKAAKILFTTVLYSWLIMIIAYVFGYYTFTPKTLYKSLFPISNNTYWFMTTYFMLYLFVPYINKIIMSTERNILNQFMMITTFLWIIIPTFTSANYCFSHLAGFIYLYFIGASIRLKTFASIFSNKKLFKILFVLSCAILLTYYFVKCSGSKINMRAYTEIERATTFFVVSIAVYIFHYFKDLKIGYNKLINQISISVLGVYLFHENFIVRDFLWKVVFHPCDVMNKPYMILYMLYAVALIFVWGIIIDKLIMFVFKKPMNKVIAIIKDSSIFKRIIGFEAKS